MGDDPPDFGIGHQLDVCARHVAASMLRFSQHAAALFARDLEDVGERRAGLGFDLRCHRVGERTGEE
jgi:hypothetical protein